MANTAAPVTVVIINAGNTTEVHGPGCSDIKKKATKHGDTPWEVQVASEVDLSHLYWNDQISDNCDPESEEGWATAAAWLGEFKFLPCCPKLVHDHRNEAAPVEVDRAQQAIEDGKAHILKKMPSHGLCDHAQTPQARRKCRNARKAAASK